MKIIRSIWQKTMVYTLLGIYAFALIRPILPVVNDVIAHIFFRFDHMATVHYENGKYHIHMELRENGEKPETTNTAERLAFSELLSSHLKNVSIEIPCLFVSEFIKRKSLCINLPIDIYFPPNSPPPEA